MVGSHPFFIAHNSGDEYFVRTISENLDNIVEFRRQKLET